MRSEIRETSLGWNRGNLVSAAGPALFREPEQLSNISSRNPDKMEHLTLRVKEMVGVFERVPTSWERTKQDTNQGGLHDARG